MGRPGRGVGRWPRSDAHVLPEGTLGDVAVVLLTGPAPLMLCGTRLRHTWPGAPGQPVSEFPDENLAGPACERSATSPSAPSGTRSQETTSHEHRAGSLNCGFMP
jgi:hypothetical protein